MIVFDLECINGHTFEGWFEDRRDFEVQCEQGQVACPLCESVDIQQKLSAVAVKTSAQSRRLERRQKDIMAGINRKLNRFIETNFENVGPDFAKEALKIHYGNADPKNIRGTTTPQEDRMLNQEGVPVVKLPVPETPDKKLN